MYQTKGLLKDLSLLLSFFKQAHKEAVYLSIFSQNGECEHMDGQAEKWIMLEEWF